MNAQWNIFHKIWDEETYSLVGTECSFSEKKNQHNMRYEILV